MRRLILALVGLLLAPFAAAQVIGVQPTPMGLYQWSSTQAQFNVLPNSYALFPAQSTPQPFAFYGYNSSLHQWVPCDIVTNSCNIGGGIGTYPAGTGVVTVVGGAAWGTTLGTLGSGNQVILPSGSPAAGKYIDGATFAWTALPFQTLTTLGNSGPSSLNAGVLNVPIYSAFNSNIQCGLGLNGLVGAFTDGSGVIQGGSSAFLCIGNGPSSFQVPSGATQVQLGVNDGSYFDNTGSFSVSLSKNGASPSTVSVPGTAQPWSPSLNTSYPYGVNDGTSPVVALTGLAAGDTITITRLSGTVSCGGGCPSTDAGGWIDSPPGPASGGGPTGTNLGAFGYRPTRYMNNGFLASGAITGLTGDGTATGPGSVAFVLATVNSAVGTCGDATHVGQVTLNGKGLATNCTPVAITGTGGLNQLTNDVNAGPGSGSQAATVVGLQNKALPSPSLGYLLYDGSALNWIALPTSNITSSTSIALSCGQWIRATSASPITITLPTATAAMGTCPTTIERGVSAGAITIATTTGTYDGVAANLQLGEAMTIFTDGTNWHSQSVIVPGVNCSWTPALTGNTLNCAGSAANFADNEVPSGTINGSNVTFTLAHTPSASASLQLYENGRLEIQGSDYTLSTNTITMAVAPLTAEVLNAFYRY